MSDRPQPQPSRDQGTESSMSAFNDGTLFHDPRRPGNAGERSSNTSGPRKLDFNTRDLIADMDLPPGHSLQEFKERIRPGPHPKGSGTQDKPEDKLGGNDLVGQGLPKPSLVQQGKQKVPQKGEASTAEPSVGMSGSRDTLSREQWGKQLTNLYKRAEKVEKTSKAWPDEQVDFIEAYVAFSYNPVTKSMSYKLLRKEYTGLDDYYTPEAYIAKAHHIINGVTRKHNRWQSLCLDGI